MLVPSLTPLISEDELKRRIAELAGEIAADLDNDVRLTVVGLLRGCFIFMADLIRELAYLGVTLEEIDFLIVTSYGPDTISSGNIKIERDIHRDIRGRNILVVDDILDTGLTLERVLDLLGSREPASLRTCVLLDKPFRRRNNLTPDYVGFTIPDRFVVGYGLDFNQFYRELPYIVALEEAG